MPQLLSTISSEGQVTIPAEVRRHLGVGTGDEIAFVLTDVGAAEVRPARSSLKSVVGSIEALPNESVDLDREITHARKDATRLRYIPIFD